MVDQFLLRLAVFAAGAVAICVAVGMAGSWLIDRYLDPRRERDRGGRGFEVLPGGENRRESGVAGTGGSRWTRGCSWPW